jgi:hypothetical protein
MKKLYNIFTLLAVALVGLSLTACSNDDLDTNPYNKSGVNLLAFGPSPNTRSQEIRITGTNLTAVEKVIFPGGTIERAGQTIKINGAEVLKANFNSVDNENIYVNIPDETVPGQIKLVAGNDTVTSVGTLTFKEPIEVTSVAPLTGLNAGDEITITGDYVYNIAEVIFPSGVSGAPVAAEEFTYVSRKEIRLRVPLAAESGIITMNDGADWELEYKNPIEVQGATVTEITPSADFGEQIQITGTNLHIVESVLFPGGVSAEFTISDDHKTITATVPAECKSGALSLLLYSGAALTTPEFAVPTVTIESATPKIDLVEGDEVTLKGQNFNRVIGVSLPGVGDILDYNIVDDNTLTFTVPEEMTDGDVVLTQNNYITATVTVEMRKLEGVIWMGKENLSGWSNWGVFSWSGDIWNKFQQAINAAGQLTLHFKVTGDNAVFNLRMGDWSTPFSDISIPYGDDGNIRPSQDDTDIIINLTAEEQQAMFGDGGKGIVIWGDGIQLQYIKFIAAGAERVLWEGNVDTNSGWTNIEGIGSDEGIELKAIDPQPGAILRIYADFSAGWQMKLLEGHWGPLYWGGADPDAAAPDDGMPAYDLDANGGCVKVTITQAMLDAAYTKQWWGGTFIIQGQNFVLKKLTVAPL